MMYLGFVYKSLSCLCCDVMSISMFKVTGHHFDTLIIKAYMYVKVLECCIEVFYNKIGNALSYSKFILRRHFEENWDNLWINILVQYSNNGEK